MPGPAVGLVGIGHDLGQGAVGRPAVGRRRGVVDRRSGQRVDELEASLPEEDQPGRRLRLLDRFDWQTKFRRRARDMVWVGGSQRREQQQRSPGILGQRRRAA